jgi:hypothetical protein
MLEGDERRWEQSSDEGRLPEVYSDPDDVARELDRFGLAAEPFQIALRRARLEWATCTHFDPPSYPGTVFWGTTVRSVREELIAIGWTKADPRNFSLVIRPTETMAIVVETGDEQTGNPSKYARPSTKAPKGISIQEAVEANVLQLDLFRVPVEHSDANRRLLTYIFLVRIDGEGHTFGELSLPKRIVDGKVVEWERRIVIPMNAEDDNIPGARIRRGPEPGPDVDVIVNRRGL